MEEELPMKKMLISLFLVLLMAANCSRQSTTPFVFSPQQPQPGQEITVRYNPAATPLRDAESIEMVAYEFGTDLKARAQEVAITRKGKTWRGSFVPDSTTLVVLVKFKSDEASDINDPDGYKIVFHDANGDTLPGVRTALAYCYFTGAYPVRLKRNPQKALELIRQEFALFPDQKEKHLSLFWNILLRADRKNGKAKVLAALDSIASLTNLTLNQKKDLASFYERLNQKDKAEQFKQQIREAEPKGELVQSERFRQFYQEADLNKMIRLYEQFQRDFPDSKNIRYMASRIAGKYAELKRFDEAEEFLSSLGDKADANAYNSLAWSMVEKEINLKTAARLAKRGVELARKAIAAPITEKPAYLTEKEWRNQKKYSLGMVLDTYATALYKLGQVKESLPLFEEAVELTRKAQNDINDRYARALVEVGENEKALQFVTCLLEEGTKSETLTEVFKKAYQAVKGTEQGLEAALAAAQEVGLKKLRDELSRQLLDQPAPDFSLIDLDGDTVSLGGLKGKTLVLDFWATWCGPCIASFPGMQKAVEKFKDDNNVQFLFINTWERGEGIQNKVRDFIKQHDYPFHVLLDSQNKVVADYGVEGIPTKFIVDKNGKIRFKSVGFSGDENKLVEELSMLIDMVK